MECETYLIMHLLMLRCSPRRRYLSSLTVVPSTYSRQRLLGSCEQTQTHREPWRVYLCLRFQNRESKGIIDDEIEKEHTHITHICHKPSLEPN
jgi:hypothetical protein